jgi:hypothetical protein
MQQTTVKRSAMKPEQVETQKISWRMTDTIVKCNYDTNDIVALQLPQMVAPFGFKNQRESEKFATAHDKYIMNIEVDENKPEHRPFFELIQKLEELGLNFIAANSKQIWKKEKSVSDLIEEEIVKKSLSKKITKDDKTYNSNIKTNIPMTYQRDEKKQIIASGPTSSSLKVSIVRKNGSKIVKVRDQNINTGRSVDFSWARKRFECIPVVCFEGFTISKKEFFPRWSLMFVAVFEYENPRELDYSNVFDEIADESESTNTTSTQTNSNHVQDSEHYEEYEQEVVE